jgi:dolichyl-phosphate beta-glucosyltransferase
MSLSIIIPAYNEAQRIRKSLEEVLAYLNELKGENELIVVDDGSSDDTVKVVEDVFANRPDRVETRVIGVVPNRGKGHAVRAGLLAARAPIALFTDADLSTPIVETPRLISPIRTGQYDVVFGSRALDRKMIGVHQPWTREQSGRIFNRVMRLATGLPFWDTQCGFKAFRMDVCRPFVERTLIDRFGFDVELLYLAHKSGLRLLETAVRWNDVEGSKVSFRSGLQGFVELREVRRNASRGLYAEAISLTKQTATRARTERPTLLSDDIESDVSPELASQRI